MNAQEIMATVEYDTNGGCWLHPSPNDTGYGYWKGFGSSHRHSYRVFKGDIPKGLIVRHMCDVRCCVNPQHLVVGTHRDNTEDRMRSRREKPWFAHKPHGKTGPNYKTRQKIASSEAAVSAAEALLLSLEGEAKRYSGNTLFEIGSDIEEARRIRDRAYRRMIRASRDGDVKSSTKANSGMNKGDLK